MSSTKRGPDDYGNRESDTALLDPCFRCCSETKETTMDMKTLRLESREGDRVRWVPEEANGDTDHACCQDGTISRFDGRRVMVKIDETVARHGFDGAQEVAVDPRTVRVLTQNAEEKEDASRIWDVGGGKPLPDGERLEGMASRNNG